jgi:hypothetical protein
MSHFVVYTILPEGTEKDSIESKIEDMLAPFSEHLEVDGYDKECWCVGSVARREAVKKADDELGKDISEFREEYWNMPEGERPEWEDHIKPLVELRNKYEKEHPLYNQPDEECDECNGTGYYESTYNPQSKWDWYVIGGRWHGYIRGEDTNLDQYVDNVDKNINTTDNLLFLDNSPFAVLTPDGTWHEKGEMGWFGMASNEKSEDDWLTYYNKVLDKYPNHTVVAVDCHI